MLIHIRFFFGPKYSKYFCLFKKVLYFFLISFVCVEVLRPSQPNGVMSSAVSLPNHMFTGQD